jgi:hypothetical protein
MEFARSAGAVAGLCLAAHALAAQCPDGRSAETCAKRRPIAVDANVIAIFPFRVRGADPSLALLRDGMPELLAAMFTGEGGPRALDMGTMFRGWAAAGGDRAFLDEKRALELAQNLGAGQALIGAVVSAGASGRIALTARVLDAVRGVVRIQPVTITGPIDSLPALGTGLATRLLARGVDRTNGVEGLTSSSEALHEYIQGREAFRRKAPSNPHFMRALELDSSFALAAYWLAVDRAIEDGRTGNADRAFRLAWTNRDQLNVEQRALIEATLGPTGLMAFESRLRVHLALERASRFVRGPEVWEMLGESYFHYGALMGLENWHDLARDAFERAISIDSLAGVSPHLATLALVDRDVRALERRTARIARLDADTLDVPWLRYSAAVLKGNRAEIHSTRERLALHFRGFLAYANTFIPRPEMDSLFARIVVRDPKADITRITLVTAQNSGQPSRAEAIRRTLPENERDLEVLKSAEDDSTSADRLTALIRSSARVPWDIRCEVALSNLRRADTTGLKAAVVALRAETGKGAAAPEAHACASLAEALGATLSPESPMQPLLLADSLMRWKAWDTPSGNMNPHWSYDLALGFARHGEYRAAAAAARRRLIGRAVRLAVMLRDEGHWAALAGDTARAVRALRQYVTLRENPEPSKLEEFQRMRAELASLTSQTKTPPPKPVSNPTSTKPSVARPSRNENR